MNLLGFLEDFIWKFLGAMNESDDMARRYLFTGRLGANSMIIMLIKTLLLHCRIVFAAAAFIGVSYLYMCASMVQVQVEIL